MLHSFKRCSQFHTYEVLVSKHFCFNSLISETWFIITEIKCLKVNLLLSTNFLICTDLKCKSNNESGLAVYSFFLSLHFWKWPFINHLFSGVYSLYSLMNTEQRHVFFNWTKTWYLIVFDFCVFTCSYLLWT